LGRDVLVEALPRWAAGQIVPVPQDDSLATYAPKVEREDGRLDWSLPAVELWRRVRAYRGWPDAFTTWQGKQLKVLAARVEETGARREGVRSQEPGAGDGPPLPLTRGGPQGGAPRWV